MSTRQQLRKSFAPWALEALKNGTASPELRAAYAMQLTSAGGTALLAAGIETQADWIEPQLIEPQDQPSAPTMRSSSQLIFF